MSPRAVWGVSWLGKASPKEGKPQPLGENYHAAFELGSYRFSCFLEFGETNKWSLMHTASSFIHILYNTGLCPCRVARYSSCRCPSKALLLLNNKVFVLQKNKVSSLQKNIVIWGCPINYGPPP